MMMPSHMSEALFHVHVQELERERHMDRLAALVPPSPSWTREVVSRGLYALADALDPDIRPAADRSPSAA
jgi:hypothetical protein